MEIKSIKKLKILLNLYKLKRGTIKQISEKCGSKREYGTLYTMKPFLLKYGILSEVKKWTYSDAMKIAYYNINHSELDRFIFTETPLKIIYDRIWNGKYISLSKIKPKEDWNNGPEKIETI